MSSYLDDKIAEQTVPTPKRPTPSEEVTQLRKKLDAANKSIERLEANAALLEAQRNLAEKERRVLQYQLADKISELDAAIESSQQLEAVNTKLREYFSRTAVNLAGLSKHIYEMRCEFDRMKEMFLRANAAKREARRERNAAQADARLWERRAENLIDIARFADQITNVPYQIMGNRGAQSYLVTKSDFDALQSAVQKYIQGSKNESDAEACVRAK